MVVKTVFVKSSIDRTGILRGTRSGCCKLRSKRFWSATVCWDSLNLSLIGGSKKCQTCNGRSRERKRPRERKGAKGHRVFNQSREGQQTRWVYQCPATRGPATRDKLKKIQNICSWLPIWAQASWSTIIRMVMAHTVTVNHRGVAIPATSPQGQPTSPQG